jgi:hypothetical protein
VGVLLKRLAIVASVALNLGFLSAVLARSGADLGPAAAEPHMTIEPRQAAPDGYTGYGNYYATLQSRGLSAQEAKGLLLARLEARARELAIEAPPPYWQRDAGSGFLSSLRLSAELDQARAALLEVFGASAEHEPEFARLFRPLDPMFSFMSSAQQVAVQKLKLEQRVGLLADPELGVYAADPSRLSSGVNGAANEFAENLGTVLDPKTIHEYLLRDSPLAEQLRRSGVEFTETEFRQTFDTLRSLEQSLPDADVLASARNSLRALLGGRRFAALWAARDPLFASVQRIGEKHALESETVLTVYELFNDHQDALLEVVRSANGDQQRQVRGLEEAQTSLETRLSGLVGADVADEIVRGYAEQAMALGRRFANE